MHTIQSYSMSPDGRLICFFQYGRTNANAFKQTRRAICDSLRFIPP